MSILTKFYRRYSNNNINICIAGGGNASHLAAAMFKKNGFNTNLYLSLKSEYEQFESNKNKNITVYKNNQAIYTSKPDRISNCPDIVNNADIVILMVPAFAYNDVLSEIAPHISQRKRTVWIGAIPGTGGFNWAVQSNIINNSNIKIFSGVCLPWATRIIEYGKSCELFGAKKQISVAVDAPLSLYHKQKQQNVDDEDLKQLEVILNNMYEGTKICVNKYSLNATLFPTNQIIHPAVMYGHFKDWKKGNIYRKSEIPLFYHDATELAAITLEQLGNELQSITQNIEDYFSIKLDTVCIYEHVSSAYANELKGSSTLYQALRSNPPHRTLKAPMKLLDHDAYIPDFHSRYLSEDIPYGLVVLKGIHELLVKASYPSNSQMIDNIILWAQNKLDKQYLIDNKLDGTDIKQSGCPQRYNIYDLKDI